MQLADFLHKLNTAPDTIEFGDTISVIEALYRFTPTAFTNGSLVNQPGQNSGSCKLFAFARLQGFDIAQTLACFGAYYRNDVLLNPAGSDHQNIRNFMRTGWDGIRFTAPALAPLAPRVTEADRAAHWDFVATLGDKPVWHDFF